MKKVRSLLILLLAALMLTVFVGCDNNKGLDQLPPEDEGTTTPTQGFKRLEPGNLIISKYYIGSNTDKMFVISNVGSEPINLGEYKIGMRKPGVDEKYTSLQELPSVTLSAGKSLYVLNDYQGSLANLFELFPNLQTLPIVAKNSTEVVEEDSLTTAISCFFRDDTTLEIVNNVGASFTPEGSRFPTYESWDIVDTVLVEDKIPAVPSALVREYDAASHTDNGWTDVSADLSRLNPAKGSVVPDVDVAEDQKVSAETALKFVKAYRNANDKVYVIQNVSADKYVDLSTVNIVWKSATDAKDVRKADLPAQSLAPGKSLYIVKDPNKAKLITGILALPEVEATGKVISEDSRCSLPNNVGNATGSWGISLVENIIDTGEKNAKGYAILKCDNPIDILEIKDQYAWVKGSDGNWLNLAQGSDQATKDKLATREILDQIEPIKK